MSITHCREEKDASRSDAMLGRATFTMVTSTSRMKAPRQIATRGSHLRMGWTPFGCGLVGAAVRG